MVSSLSYLANGKIGDIFVGFAHFPPKNTLPPYCYHANEKQLAMERLRNDSNVVTVRECFLRRL